MKVKHGSICSSVAFVPQTRCREIISGGYDCKLLHHEVLKGGLQSKHEIPASSPSTESFNMCPPFIQAIAMSQSGVCAAGTADGRIWLGKGAFVGPNGSKAVAGKQIKWKGVSKLTDQNHRDLAVATGPVVAICIIAGASEDGDAVLSLSHLGKLQAHRMPLALSDLPTSSLTNENWNFDLLWEKSTKTILKTNGLACSPLTDLEGRDGWWVAVGGVGTGGKGFVETWFLAREDLRDRTDNPTSTGSQ